MKYQLTQHARDVMAERQIPVEWMEHALNNPEKTEPDTGDAALEHSLALIAQHGNRVLRVVYNKSVDPVRVVTVYFDRKMKGKL